MMPMNTPEGAVSDDLSLDADMLPEAEEDFDDEDYEVEHQGQVYRSQPLRACS